MTSISSEAFKGNYLWEYGSLKRETEPSDDQVDFVKHVFGSCLFPRNEGYRRYTWRETRQSPGAKGSPRILWSNPAEYRNTVYNFRQVSRERVQKMSKKPDGCEPEFPFLGLSVLYTLSKEMDREFETVVNMALGSSCGVLCSIDLAVAIYTCDLYADQCCNHAWNTLRRLAASRLVGCVKRDVLERVLPVMEKLRLFQYVFAHKYVGEEGDQQVFIDTYFMRDGDERTRKRYLEEACSIGNTYERDGIGGVLHSLKREANPEDASSKWHTKLLEYFLYGFPGLLDPIEIVVRHVSEGPLKEEEMLMIPEIKALDAVPQTNEQIWVRSMVSRVDEIYTYVLSAERFRDCPLLSHILYENRPRMKNVPDWSDELDLKAQGPYEILDRLLVHEKSETYADVYTVYFSMEDRKEVFNEFIATLWTYGNALSIRTAVIAIEESDVQGTWWTNVKKWFWSEKIFDRAIREMHEKNGEIDLYVVFDDFMKSMKDNRVGLYDSYEDNEISEDSRGFLRDFLHLIVHYVGRTKHRRETTEHGEHVPVELGWDAIGLYLSKLYRSRHQNVSTMFEFWSMDVFYPMLQSLLSSDYMLEGRRYWRVFETIALASVPTDESFRMQNTFSPFSNIEQVGMYNTQRLVLIKELYSAIETFYKGLDPAVSEGSLIESEDVAKSVLNKKYHIQEYNISVPVYPCFLGSRNYQGILLENMFGIVMEKEKSTALYKDTDKNRDTRSVRTRTKLISSLGLLLRQKYQFMSEKPCSDSVNLCKLHGVRKGSKSDKWKPVQIQVTSINFKKYLDKYNEIIGTYYKTEVEHAHLLEGRELHDFVSSLLPLAKISPSNSEINNNLTKLHKYAVETMGRDTSDPSPQHERVQSSPDPTVAVFDTTSYTEQMLKDVEQHHCGFPLIQDIGVFFNATMDINRSKKVTVNSKDVNAVLEGLQQNRQYTESRSNHVLFAYSGNIRLKEYRSKPIPLYKLCTSQDARSSKYAIGPFKDASVTKSISVYAVFSHGRWVLTRGHQGWELKADDLTPRETRNNLFESLLYLTRETSGDVTIVFENEFVAQVVREKHHSGSMYPGNSSLENVYTVLRKANERVGSFDQHSEIAEIRVNPGMYHSLPSLYRPHDVMNASAVYQRFIGTGAGRTLFLLDSFGEFYTMSMGSPGKIVFVNDDSLARERYKDAQYIYEDDNCGDSHHTGRTDGWMSEFDEDDTVNAVKKSFQEVESDFLRGHPNLSDKLEPLKRALEGVLDNILPASDVRVTVPEVFSGEEGTTISLSNFNADEFTYGRLVIYLYRWIQAQLGGDTPKIWEQWVRSALTKLKPCDEAGSAREKTEDSETSSDEEDGKASSDEEDEEASSDVGGTDDTPESRILGFFNIERVSTKEHEDVPQKEKVLFDTLRDRTFLLHSFVYARGETFNDVVYRNLLEELFGNRDSETRKWIEDATSNMINFIRDNKTTQDTSDEELQEQSSIRESVRVAQSDIKGLDIRYRKPILESIVLGVLRLWKDVKNGEKNPKYLPAEHMLLTMKKHEFFSSSSSSEGHQDSNERDAVAFAPDRNKLRRLLGHTTSGGIAITLYRSPYELHSTVDENCVAVFFRGSAHEDQMRLSRFVRRFSDKRREIRKDWRSVFGGLPDPFVLGDSATFAYTDSTQFVDDFYEDSETTATLVWKNGRRKSRSRPLFTCALSKGDVAHRRMLLNRTSAKGIIRDKLKITHTQLLEKLRGNSGDANQFVDYVKTMAGFWRRLCPDAERKQAPPSTVRPIHMVYFASYSFDNEPDGNIHKELETDLQLRGESSYTWMILWKAFRFDKQLASLPTFVPNADTGFDPETGCGYVFEKHLHVPPPQADFVSRRTTDFQDWWSGSAQDWWSSTEGSLTVTSTCVWTSRGSAGKGRTLHLHEGGKSESITVLLHSKNAGDCTKIKEESTSLYPNESHIILVVNTTKDHQHLLGHIEEISGRYTKQVWANIREGADDSFFPQYTDWGYIQDETHGIFSEERAQWENRFKDTFAHHSIGLLKQLKENMNDAAYSVALWYYPQEVRQA